LYLLHITMKKRPSMFKNIKFGLVFIFLISVILSVHADEINLGKGSKFIYSGKEIEISTDFENGGLARIEENETNVFECWPYEEEEYRDGWIYLKSLIRDTYDHTGFCFHFRIDGCMNKNITFNFHIIERQNESNESVVYFNPDFPVYSYDEDKWDRMENKTLRDNPEKENWKIISVEQVFTEDNACLAFLYPYTNSHLERHIKRIQNSPFCKIEIAGHSTEGKEIKQISITDPEIPLKEKKVAWFIGLQHCTELGAGWGLEGMVEFLLSEDPIAREAREIYLFKIIPIVNVDALSEGKGRIHSSGKNLNREWGKVNPVTEIASIKKTLDDWKENGNSIDIFIDFHGFSSKEGKWWLFFLPEETYVNKQAEDYKRLIKTLEKYIPSISSYSKPALELGMARGAGFHQFGALSLAFDGFVYPFPAKWEPPDLSNYYSSGDEILPLESCKACGEAFVQALVEFAGEKKESKIEAYKLLPNYPNPFNSGTTISYQLLKPAYITLTIYNITGQSVMTLIEESLDADNYAAVWDGRDNKGRKLESGVYFVRLEAGDFMTSRKIMLLK